MERDRAAWSRRGSLEKTGSEGAEDFPVPQGGETHAPTASGIPEGWEPIAPGRAKHAPGERARCHESAPRQGVRRSAILQPLPGLIRVFSA